MAARRARWGIVLAALSLALLLSGCAGGARTSGSARPAHGTIIIWENWSERDLGEHAAIVNGYELAHPGVTIQLVHQDDPGPAAIAAERKGPSPDIVAVSSDELGTLVANRDIIPLDAYLGNGQVAETFIKPAAQAVRLGGHTYGVPASVETITLLYNKSLVAFDQLPRTTDQMPAFERAYAQQHPGGYGLVWPTADAYFDAPWLYGFGGYYLKDDGTVGLSSPGAIAGARFIASFRTLLPTQIDVPSARALFNEGKAAAIIDGPTAYTAARAAGIDVRLAMLPVVGATNTPATPLVRVNALAITTASRIPALSADFLRFYANEASQVAMAKVTGAVPANLAAVDDAGVRALPAVGGFATQARLGVALPAIPAASHLWGPTNAALAAIWSGAQTPEAALSAARQAVQAIVNASGPAG